MADISSSFLQRALTLRHLRLLIALEDLQQVGRVATALNISQPAVSKALVEIESGVGVPLFDRTPRGMLPTAHGACLLRYAHAMANELSRAVDELTGIEQGIAASVSVGAIIGTGTGYLLNAAILQCRERLPELTVTVAEGTRELVLRQLRTGRLDLVIGAVGDAVAPAELDSTALYIDSLAIVCGTRHPLATRRKLALAEVLSQDWVLPPRSARVRASFEALFCSTGAARPRVLAETVSLDLIMELLARPGGPGPYAGRRHAGAGDAGVGVYPRRHSRVQGGADLQELPGRGRGIALSGPGPPSQPEERICTLARNAPWPSSRACRSATCWSPRLRWIARRKQGWAARFPPPSRKAAKWPGARNDRQAPPPRPMKIKQVFDAITSCDGADANEGARVRSRPQAVGASHLAASR